MIRFRCSRCTHEVEVDESLAGQAAMCPLCRENIVVPAASQVPVMPEPPRMSGWANAALICGVVAWVVGITSIPAVIFGVIGIRQINRSEGRLKGMGEAVGGLVLGGLFLLLIPLVILPALTRVWETAHSMQDAVQLKMIGFYIFTYADENNGRYPTVYADPQAAGEQWGPGFDPKTGVIGDALAPGGPGVGHGPYTCNLSCLYLLVRQGPLRPEHFVCPTLWGGPKSVAPNAAKLWSFGNIDQCSYSFQNQLGHNTVLKDLDPRVIIAADASPLRPGTKLPPDGKKPWEHNSPNHDFKGQNCLHADGFIEFVETPNCGYGGNNIWLRSTLPDGSPKNPDPKPWAEHIAPLPWVEDVESYQNPMATVGDKYDTWLVP